VIIEVQELKEIIEIVLQKYISNYGKSLKTDNDYYWFINPDNGYNFKEVPNDEEFLVGSLVDDYTSLKQLLDEKGEVSIIDLDRISSILTVISYEIEKLNDIDL